MNSRRSMWKLFVGVAGVGLLVSNCTIKTEDDDGKSAAGDAGTSNNAGSGNNAGATNNAGTGEIANSAGATGVAGEAGASTAGGSAGDAAGEAGAGGESGFGPTDCYGCLTQLCAGEWDACEAESELTTTDPNGNYCLSDDLNAAPGQIELVIACITRERAIGLVKRDAVRACGSSLGRSAQLSFTDWPPADMTMTPATEGLLNCMADKPDEVDNPGAWATDTTANFPASGPRPWDDMTCAKLACTSAEL